MRHREGENRCKLTGGILNQKGTGEDTIESSVSSRTTIEQPRRSIVPGLGSTEMTTTTRRDETRRRERNNVLATQAGRQAGTFLHPLLLPFLRSRVRLQTKPAFVSVSLSAAPAPWSNASWSRSITSIITSLVCLYYCWLVSSSK